MTILKGIVESALQHTNGDAQSQALRHEEKCLEDAFELARMCKEWDNDQSNTISKTEFQRMAQSGEFSRYLGFIGLDISHIRSFFDLISGPEEEAVSIETFVAGCMRLRGFAKSSDLLTLMLDLGKLKKGQQRLYADICSELAELKADLANELRQT